MLFVMKNHNMVSDEKHLHCMIVCASQTAVTTRTHALLTGSETRGARQILVDMCYSVCVLEMDVESGSVRDMHHCTPLAWVRSSHFFVK